MPFWEEQKQIKHDDGTMHMYERWRRWRLPRVLWRTVHFGYCSECGYAVKALNDSVKLCKNCYKKKNRRKINREKRF